MKRVCVFCASSAGTQASYTAAAEELATSLARAGVGVVYGGAHIGLMGRVADAALAHGGEVIGVIPQGLKELEIAHQGLTELREVSSMHARKALMAELSDAFVALPGGLGTLDELCEILTWRQLGIHGKPVGVLNVDGFFDGMLAQMDRAVHDGLLRSEQRELLIVAQQVPELVQALSAEHVTPRPHPPVLVP